MTIDAPEGAIAEPSRFATILVSAEIHREPPPVREKIKRGIGSY